MRALWIAFVVAAELAGAQTTPPSEEVVDLKYFASYVNRENCSKDQRRYLACISALQVLTAALDSELNLKTQTTGVDFLGLGKTRLALNANNLQLVSQAHEAANMNVDVNASVLQQVFLQSQKSKTDFLRDFAPAFYHFKVASNDVIADVLEFLSRTYSAKLKEEIWMAAINEYIHISSDPHSDWRLVEDTAKSFRSKEDEFIGLGIRFVESPIGATVETVVKGSGAEAAGLAPDDTILNVNGQELQGLRREMVSKAMRGEEGGVLALKVLRNGKTFEVTTTRKKVVTPVVSRSIFKSGEATVGLVRLENFSYSDACEDVGEVLKEFNSAKVDQVLLDLRGNGGGAIPIAECMAGLFVGPGEAIGYTEGRSFFGLPAVSKGPALDRARQMLKDEIELFLVEAGTNINDEVYQDHLKMLRSPDALTHLARTIELNDHGLSAMHSKGKQVYGGKLAVLVDGGSASASELIAGAFRDLNRALIVGQTTYGKGSYQSSGTKYGRFQRWQTGGLFFQPSGSTNQTIGVKPHIEAFRDIEPSVVERFQMREKDLFLYPLEPRSIRQVVHDADEMDKLHVSRECLESQNVKAAFASAATPRLKDMQVLTAVAALSCLN